MAITYKQLSPSLYLVQQTVAGGPKKVTVAPALNHILVVDCSGSMTSDLAKLRGQLKQRLKTMLRPDDTFTLIWFSGRGQCGVLFDAETIATLADLQRVCGLIDRWLVPIGMTGFKEPLLQVYGAMDKLDKNGRPYNLIFMSDGQDNQWPRAEILEAAERLKGRVVAATFVEYGYYADRRMLAALAQSVGGVHIFAEDFDKYDPIFTRALTQEIPAAPRVELKIPLAPVGGFVFTSDARDLIAFEARIHSGQVSALISGDTAVVWYLLHDKPSEGTERSNVTHDDPMMTAAYAAISLFATRRQPDIVYPLLQLTGDVRHIKAFSTCFSHQEYTAFMEETRAATLNKSGRLKAGYDPTLVPAEDAYTILHLLEDLRRDDRTRVCLDHPAFRYTRISRRRLNADENLTIAEQARVEEISEKIGGTRDAKVLQALQVELNAILSRKRDALVFTADPAPDGYELDGLTFHGSQPNISIRIKKTGSVDLTSRAEAMPAGLREALGRAVWAIPAFQTHIYRNYAIVSHGLVNVAVLPVKISREMWQHLADRDVTMEPAEGGVTLIHLASLPILNRGMVQSIRAREAVELEFHLTRSRAYQKVYKYAVEETYPGEKLADFAGKYGDEGAAWLKEQGITSGGFSPNTTVAPSVDFITGREFNVKLAGYSTLPPVADVMAKLDKIAAGDKKAKLNGPEKLMAEALNEIGATVAKYRGEVAKPCLDNEAALKQHLIDRQKSLVHETRGMIYKAARMKFAITVGQVWFRDLEPDQNTIEVQLAGVGPVKGTMELREIEIKV